MKYGLKNVQSEPYHFGRKVKSRLRSARLLAGVGVIFAAALRAGAVGPPLPYPVVIVPGTPAENNILGINLGTTVAGGARVSEQGQSWDYNFAVAPGDRCYLELQITEASPLDPLQVLVLGADNKPIASKIEQDPKDALTYVTFWTVPQNWPVGSHMTVRFTTKAVSVAIKRIRFRVQPQDLNGDGFPDYLSNLMTQGLPAGTRPTILRMPSRPYTVFQSGHLPDPTLDPQTDAVFAYTSGAEAIQGWKQRGYTVWTMGGAREDTNYLKAHPDEGQTDAAGHPITIGGNSAYLDPTANRIAIERGYFDTALMNGSEGVCPEEPEYFARAGYESAFKAYWQRTLGSPWRDPASSLSARWQAGQLMARLETDHIAGILNPLADQKPAVRRFVAVHSPIHYAFSNIVSPQYAITSMPSVQEVIGQVWTGTARTPMRYVGLRKDWTFSLAYLEYSSLYHLMRGTGKRLWFLADPLEDDPTRTLADYKSHYEQTLIASLLFPDIDAYEVMPWPERVYGHIPAEYATEINTIAAALEDMHNQPTASGNAMANANVGVFVSDTMQWQREAPGTSDPDAFAGLTLPLLQRGVPVQALSLDRAAEPNYLRPFKTLLLSYDYQKPLSARVQAGLAQWVREGGCLLFFGGSDVYNGVPETWWRQANMAAPQLDLMRQLGIVPGDQLKEVTPPGEDLSRYQTVLKADPAEHDLKNRRTYTLDLTPFAKQTGSVAVRFSDVTPQDGWGAWLSSVKLDIGGKLAASFLAGSDLESRFQVFDNNSLYNGQARFADNNASWTYEFDNLPTNSPVTLTLDMGNGFSVSAAAVKPGFGHTLLSASGAESVARTFPRLRIPSAYPATLYPQAPIRDDDPNAKSRAAGPYTLYTLRSGGAAVWAQNVAKGLFINVGVAPGFFSANERTAGLLRALVQYGTRRVGGSVKETDALRLRRGRYTIVRTFDDSETVDGRTVDLLSPALETTEDREIPPHSLALLADLGPQEAGPHIGYISGRVQAKLETAAATAFYVRGPLGTTGACRLHSGGRRIAGVRAMDRLGQPVNVQVQMDGGTALLRYPNSPDGVLVRVGWE